MGFGMGLRLTRSALVAALLTFFIPLTSSAHPLKLSASMIEHDAAQNHFKLECKVFIDDFQLSLVNSILKGRDPNSVKREDRAKLVADYFQKFYSVRHNDRKLVWKVHRIVPLYRENVLVIQLHGASSKLKKGDTVTVENTIMFPDFGSTQTNRTVLLIPSFKIDDGHAATMHDYKMTYVLGERKR